MRPPADPVGSSEREPSGPPRRRPGMLVRVAWWALVCTAAVAVALGAVLQYGLSLFTGNSPALPELRLWVWLSVGGGAALLYAALVLLARQAARQFNERQAEHQRLYAEAQQQLLAAERAEADRRTAQALL